MSVDTPTVSVVMGVYNGADTLRETLEGILGQEGIELEFIVVNDGSSDNSLKILQEYAEGDKRLKIFDQENRGLTHALIRGCVEARGEFIARQDAGDISLSGRLKKEAAILGENPDIVMVSCGTRFIGPEGEKLYDVLQSPETADNGLWKLTLDGVKGPSHHGSVIFRKKDYHAVGGYRAQFQVAQDLDLWTRLIERGKHVIVQDILYQAFVASNGISSRKRNQQINTTRLILECSRRRRRGQSEEELLQSVSKLWSPSNAGNQCRETNAAYYYFLGSCLRSKEPSKARVYYKQALLSNPFHLKALIRFLSIRKN